MAKENLNDLGTNSLGRGGERERNYPWNHLERRGRCNIGANDQRELRRFRKWVSLETSEGHEDASGEHG